MYKTINYRYAIVLVIVIAITGTSVHFVHAWQARKQADTFLKLADEATKAGNPPRAYDLLSRYLALFPNNTEVRARMGMIMARAARNGEQQYQAFFVLERVLREDRQHENDDVRRRVVHLAIDLKYYDKAIKHLEVLTAAHKNEGELFDLIGQCYVAQGEFTKAEEAFSESIKVAPDCFQAYTDLAALLRRHLSKEQQADDLIKVLLEKNPQAAQAHMIAASYWKTFDKLDVAEDEIKKALRLACWPPQAWRLQRRTTCGCTSSTPKPTQK
jgi:tetratricopeptide (TPR) repeat protein